MTDKQKLSDSIDELFTTFKDLVDSARDFVHDFMDAVDVGEISAASTPTKKEWMDMCESIWDEHFCGE